MRTAVVGDLEDLSNAYFAWRYGLHLLLDALPGTVVNPPSARRSNSSKPFQMGLLAAGGLAVPRWRVTSRRDRNERRPLGERIFDDILGEVVFGRLVSQRDAIGIDGRLEGRWYASRDRSPARVLQVRAGRLPLAEFIDLDGDGRVDMALVLEQ